MGAKLLPTTRMGVRAAAATLAALVLTRWVELERPYWVIMTAVILVTETWGESIRKAGQRLAMTVLGCLAGWLLYDLSAPYPALRPVLMLAGVFLAVYFRTGVPAGSYAPMTFFITVYVVFLFAALGSWSRELMVARVFDTALGCLVALVVSAVVLPERAARQLQGELAGFWRSCRDAFDQSCADLFGSGPPAAPAPARHELLRQLEKLRGSHLASRYEGLLRGHIRGEHGPLRQAELLCRYLLAFAAAAELPAARRVAVILRGTLQPAAERARAGLGRLAGEQFEDERPDADANLAARVAEQVRSRLEAGEMNRMDLVEFAPLAGYLEGVLAVLAEMD